MYRFILRENTVYLFLTTTIVFILGGITHLIADTQKLFSAQKASFSIKFKDEILPYRVMSIFVLPDEIISFEVIDSDKKQNYKIQVSDGKLTVISNKKWQWI